ATLHAQVKTQAKRLVKMVSSLERLNAKLTAIGNLDNLTQIPNRRAFDERLRQEWAAMKQQHRPLAVILIDIDFFKCFNDAFGHVEGDRCLRQVAQAIHGVVDQWSGLAARYGGEEFAVILSQTGRDNAIAIIQEIRKKIQQLAIPAPDNIHRHSNVVTVSAGMASQIPTGDHLQSLIEAADTALYQAKAAGRDTWREFNPSGQSIKNHKPASVIRDDPANIKNPTTIKKPTNPNSAPHPNSTTPLNSANPNNTPTNLNQS
ncbi:MAG: diguanylate cyclase, partial [Cyanobacteria bacterium P01_H01_bin.130]